MGYVRILPPQRAQCPLRGNHGLLDPVHGFLAAMAKMASRLVARNSSRVISTVDLSGGSADYIGQLEIELIDIRFVEYERLAQNHLIAAHFDRVQAARLK